jgi:hypothetical protein
MNSNDRGHSNVRELLDKARRVIRSRARTPRYWAAAERFSRLWLGEPLRASPELQLAASADLGAIIDWLYDEGEAGKSAAGAGESAAWALVKLTHRLQEVVDLKRASEELLRWETGAPDSEMSLVDATCVIVAILTTQGYATLRERGGSQLAARWLETWASFMWKQNLQQQHVCGLGLLVPLPPAEQQHWMKILALPPAALVPDSTSFSEGVREFLDRYGETSAASVAFLGSLPFSSLPLEEVDGLFQLTTGPLGLLPAMSKLLRLAPDVAFDSAESINTGVFASAAEQRRSVVEVLARGGLSKSLLDGRLQREWALYSAQMRSFFQESVTAHASQAGTATLNTLLGALYQLMDLLVPGTWKHGEK